MSTGYAYFISVLTLSFLSILAIYVFSKYKGELMINMMMTMALSMVFGLAVGVFAGIAFHGDLLYSTLTGMMVAGVIGFILGIHLHVLAGIEGFFSGMMAGMMGAMIVEMLSISEGSFLLLICFFLLIGTTMFCVRHILQQTFQSFVKRYDYILLAGTCLLLLATFWTFPFADIKEQPPIHDEEHHHRY
jgi:hypothetical protein